MKESVPAVIFDMDGTIFDSERLVLDCWERIGKKHGIGDIHEVFIRCIGTNRVRTQEIIYGHYGRDFPYEKLRYLSENKVPLGLASSTRLASVTQELRVARSRIPITGSAQRTVQECIPSWCRIFCRRQRRYRT